MRQSAPAGAVVWVAVVLAFAGTTEGRRKVLGMDLGLAEAAIFWIEFLRARKSRGLRGVQLVVADEHLGLNDAGQQALGTKARGCRSTSCARKILTRAP